MLGKLKKDEGKIPDTREKPFMNHFKILMDDDKTINNLLSELVTLKTN